MSADHDNRSAETGRYVDDETSAEHPDTTVREARSAPQPSVGRTVHYTSYGTPGGEYASQCRAAIITEVAGKTPASAQVFVSLAVLNPSGLFFDQDCLYSPEPRGGTWHWPERTPE